MKTGSGAFAYVKKLALGCLLLGLAFHCARANDDDVLKALRQIDQNLTQTVPNAFRVPISVYETPAQVKAQIVELQKHLKGAPPVEVRSIVLKALMILYSGRGNTQPRD